MGSERAIGVSPRLENEWIGDEPVGVRFLRYPLMEEINRKALLGTMNHVSVAVSPDFIIDGIVKRRKHISDQKRKHYLKWAEQNRSYVLRQVRDKDLPDEVIDELVKAYYEKTIGQDKSASSEVEKHFEFEHKYLDNLENIANMAKHSGQMISISEHVFEYLN